MKLSEKEKFIYSNLEKGFEGETKCDQLLESLQEERYVINDLLFEVNNSYFQIDTLIISQGVIHLLDIKNFQGDWYLEANRLYKVSNQNEYKNPVDQLKRCETLFRQLLNNLKQTFLVESFVIFINPEFTLYQAPMDKPIILPTQLHRFLVDLNKIPSKLNDKHKKLAQKLIALNHSKNPFTTLPSYDYELLQKGVYCENCKSFLVSIIKRDFICKNCGHHESIHHAILRNTEEYRVLFPNDKITTPGIYDWCNADLNKKTIARVLKKNYTAIGNTSSTYYQ
ncbi:DNA-directed RNA polymerase subunit M/transcription elongation factor TFIIS [Pullulanibacillus pueri]|uniref:NERD domain-containing protein n=2 Tax=Pullulanibacillus pueri TaxID=1437324 RepID=A0A8J2ZVZ8_9BACL|nr:nuclease-related domain-containing protein [Pullulanibacillus pueri]MBM7682647.1 DNA-directed RNA polymerase subunit M/transcription elongation factor TFIIS [Pullulanibacillus pueri]GGH82636.1 hypothetical protein GCM10007096_22320 [Pullulanibacillus pueri]